MNYEQFLFTRNKRRDFTAFVRPADMTNKEVSLLASAFNTITDVTALTADQPGLYCFPLGAYMFVLRFYDSGRKHAGREIAVIEGIAVRADESESLATLLPEIVERQTELLDIVGDVGEIEDIEVSRSAVETFTPSPFAASGSSQPKDAGPLSPSPSGQGVKDTLRDTPPESFSEALSGVRASDPDPQPDLQDDETNPQGADDLLIDIGTRLADDQLVLTFDEDGRRLLIQALERATAQPLRFAFGTNNEVISRLAEWGIDFDMIGIFSATEASFRPRVVKVPKAAVNAPISLPPLVEAESVTPMPLKREHHSLLGKLVGWLFGR